VEEVKKLAAALILLSSSALAQASDPYDSYLKFVQRHQVSADFKKFATSCEVDTDKIRPIYGVEVGNLWTKTSDLKRAFDGVQSDSFASAEIWQQYGKTRIVDLWSLEMDVGSEIESRICLKNEVKVHTAAVTIWNLPLAADSSGWGHKSYRTFDSNGKIIANTEYFINLQGRKIPKPKLDDVSGSVDWIPDFKVITLIESGLLGTK
jgi:hypothetical protein